MLIYYGKRLDIPILEPVPKFRFRYVQLNHADIPKNQGANLAEVRQISKSCSLSGKFPTFHKI